MQLHPHGSYDSDGRPLDLTPSSTNITAFRGHVIKQYGACLLTLTLTLTLNNSSTKHSFHVVDTTGPTILGLPTCRDMKLITLNYTITTPSTSATILKPSTSNNIQETKPVSMPRCSTPQNSNENPKAALPRDYPDCATDWVNSLVCVTKPDGTFRSCLDPKDLNKAIKRPHHCIPTIDEILPKLNGAKYFSIKDARSGYWNIKLITRVHCMLLSTPPMVDIDFYDYHLV